jgi:hypothetical protein
MIDFKKDPIYKATQKPEIITIPKMLFVMVDGKGLPEDGDKETQFQEAMQTLFGIVYTIKFWDKAHTPPAGYDKFTIAPLEGLWWTESGEMFDTHKPDEWRWTVMLRLPEFVTKEFFAEVVADVVAKKKSNIYKNARLDHFTEGESVQIMHIGPYDKEASTIERMHNYVKENGYELTGKHHELYFGDPRRTAPEKLRTILRQGVKRIES